ncbi:glycosyltransferase [Vallitalea sp.]|jgi:glycosyltransferase involved in cell wall biosynthesis|uniref:glycosyltransferase n=1 Tax=Vallitalea sp. TaxID=1882829 RepID=UPI0025EF6E32|nr:glycosyltransferase [Vallitalea sp.]MCT4686663.1 glycosyltransferase [Vallitalea sp.]
MKSYFFIIPSGNPTTTYANLLFVKALTDLGYDIEPVLDLSTKYTILKNPDCDAIFFQKTIQCPAHTKKYIEHLKGKVKLIHIDNDFQDMYKIDKLETLKITDLIIVCTSQHKRALKEYTNVPIEIVSNIVDFENYNYVPITQKSNNPLVISWQQACADAYIQDLLMIAKPLCEIHERYNTELHLYGWYMGKNHPDQRHEIREVMPFAKFIEYQPLTKYLTDIVPNLSQSDIFIMPYINHKGRWGKSSFGLKRIMLLGLPIVASNTEHHRTLIKNGENGFLATTNEQWYVNLESLVKSKDLRESFAIKSRKLIETNYNHELIIQQLINAVNKHISLFTKT